MQRRPSTSSAMTVPSSKLQTKGSLDQFCRDLEQFARQGEEILIWQAAMAVVHRFGEREGDSGAHANQRGLFNTELGRDLVGGAKADAADVACQPVGIFRDQLDSVGAIGLVDAHCPRGADTVAVQEQHDLADDPLLGPAGDDPLGAFRADAGHFAQPAGLLRNHLEHGVTKGAYELFRVDGPDAPDHPGTEVFLDPLDRRRRGRLEERGSELDAVGTIVDPAAARLDKFAGRDHRGVADDGNRIALAAGLDPQHTKAALRIVECHPVDQTGQNLCRTHHRCPRHRHMMNTEIRRCYSSAGEICVDGEPVTRLRQNTQRPARSRANASIRL